MSKVNDLLTSRFKKGSDQLAKISDLADRSTSGALSSFAGVFRVAPLSFDEKERLRALLAEYRTEGNKLEEDLDLLSSITSEVKAINNQAAILHGERIKKAQSLLKSYKDGAFTAYLMATYGNRQTPYNFLQYYELYISIPHPLKTKVEEMPRQAVYTLASRRCTQEEKEAVIQSYKGETKRELLSYIRLKFPLEKKDKRGSNAFEQACKELRRIEQGLELHKSRPSPAQKKRILEVLRSIEKLL